MSAIFSRVQHVATRAGTQLQTTTDRLIPPKQREQKLSQFHSFAHRNPKLAAFTTAQTILLGPPVLLFLAFAISTLFVSVATCLLIALTSAFIYTFFAVGFALLFLIPTLFVASFAATCFFIWGLVVYLILQRFNEGEAPAKRGTRVGDTLHGLTGDRLAWLLDDNLEKVVVLGREAETQGSNGTSQRQSGAGEWEKKWSNGTQLQPKEVSNEPDIKTRG